MDPVKDPSSHEATEALNTRRSSLRQVLAISAICMIPLIGLAISLHGRDWYPTGDQAQAELRVQGMPEQLPLVGAAGRIQDSQGRQGNHPGPLMFWATWPLYALLGGSSWAFEVSTIVLNGAWMLLSLYLVGRRAPPAALGLFGLITLGLIGGFGLDALSQPWNPWVALFPFMAMLLGLWSVFEGERAMTMVVVAAGSFTLQSHIGYLPLSVSAVGASGLALFIQAWSQRRTRPVVARTAASIGGATAVGLALWTGPILDVVRNNPNNVSKIIANFTHPVGEFVGLGGAMKALLQAANPFGVWLRGGDQVSGSPLFGAVVLVTWLGLSVALFRRNRAHWLNRLNLVLGATFIVAIITVSRVFGTLYLYVFRWSAILVALVLFATLAASTELAGLKWRSLSFDHRRSSTFACAALLLVSIVVTAHVATQELPYAQTGQMERTLSRQAILRLDRSKSYVVHWDDPVYLGGVGFGLVLSLERAGFVVGVDPAFAAAVEPFRTRCPGDYTSELTVVTGRGRIDSWRARSSATELGYADSRSTTQRQETPRLEAELIRLLRDQGTVVEAGQIDSQLNRIILSPGQPKAIVEIAEKLVGWGSPTALFEATPTFPLGIPQECRPN